MKIHQLAITAGLLGLGSASWLHAAPIVFEFEANAGQSTKFNGSTLTLEPTLGTTALTSGDIETFDIQTPNGAIIDNQNDVYLVFTNGINYSPTALTSPPPGGGQLDIGSYSGFIQIQVAPTIISESDVQAAGTWTVEGSSSVPDASATFGLLGIGLLGILGLSAAVRKRPEAALVPELA